MRYDDAKLHRLLAAEYVLGLLRGPARRRFERLAATRAEIMAEQRFWESRFAVLGTALPPVDAPERIWTNLAHQISVVETTKVTPIKRATPAAPNVPKAASPWRIVAGLAVAAAVVAVVLVGQRNAPPASVTPATTPTQGTSPTYVALLKMPEGDMQWTVSIAPAHGSLNIAAAGTVPAAVEGHSVELWWLSPNGPVAIGVVPVSGNGSLALPKDMEGATDLKLALSLEPVGGSPTGQPTGPVLTSAAAVKSA